MMHPFDLTGKNILVAGALNPIGQCIVTQLHSLGAQVVITDRDEELLQAFCDTHKLSNLARFRLDTENTGLIEGRLKHILERHSPFHGFVFAGGSGGVRPLSLNKPGFTQSMLNANVVAFIEMTRGITRKDWFANGGSIVAISSVSSIRGLKAKTAYCASKAALDAAVRCMAAELSDRHIRVNSIMKGWVSSDMEKDFIKTNMELSGDEDLRRQLLGPVEPIEIANTVAFLLSDATRTITGTSLLVDGGYTL